MSIVPDVHFGVNIDCASSTDQYRYVIVQRADTSPEQLCIAEVCVIGGEYAINYFRIDAATTLHYKALLI